MKQALAALLCVLVLTALCASQAAAHATSYRLRVLVTAYCLSGHTASGTRVSWGTVAVDPRLIRMRSRLYVPGYGRGVALDTGGAIVGHHIDVWMSSCSAAMRATRYATITVYR